MNINICGVYDENPAIANDKEQTGDNLMFCTFESYKHGCACIVFSARISHIFLPAVLLFIFVNHNASQDSQLTKSVPPCSIFYWSHIWSHEILCLLESWLRTADVWSHVLVEPSSVCIQEDYAIKRSPTIFISVKTRWSFSACSLK